MKIGVFVYNFPHYKSQQGLLNLFLNAFDVEAVFGADAVKLNFYQSKIRISPQHLYLNHPKDISERFQFDYYNTVHNSQETVGIIKNKNIDIGVILGARILSKEIIESFNIGVLNMHPGIIPINRGLDNIKWAVLDKLKQGVTTHLIEPEIDKGALIDIQELDVKADDTFVDIQLKIQELEQKMMVEALKKLQYGFEPKRIIEDGKYNKALNMQEEALLATHFEYYKKFYCHMKGIK